MLRCFNAVAAVFDERNYVKFNGRPCTWTTEKPRKAGLPFILFIGLDGAGKTTVIHTLQQASYKQPGVLVAGDRVSGGAAGTTGVGEAAAVQSTTQEDGGDRHSGSKIATAAARGQPASNSNPLAGLPVVTPATQHATLTLITTLSKSFVAVDVPGAAAYRSAWAEVMQYAEAVVLVVSCTDPMRYPVAREQLWRLLPKMARRNAPCLVLVTKRDDLEAQVTATLKLSSSAAAGAASAAAASAQLLGPLPLSSLHQPSLLQGLDTVTEGPEGTAGTGSVLPSRAGSTMQHPSTAHQYPHGVQEAEPQGLNALATMLGNNYAGTMEVRLDPEDCIADLDLPPLLAPLPAPWALRTVNAHSHTEVCEGLEWLLARVHTVRRLRRNARNGALALAGFQAANAEYAANFSAARALQQQAELLHQEEVAGQRHAEALMRKAHEMLHGGA